MATNPTALEFNGTNQFVRLPTAVSLKGLSSFTFMAWVKVDPRSDYRNQRAMTIRQNFREPSTVRFAFTPFFEETRVRKGRSIAVGRKGKLRFEFGPKDGRASVSYDHEYEWDDRWHHCGFAVRLGSRPTFDIFLDGRLVSEGTIEMPDEVTAISDTLPTAAWMGLYSPQLNSNSDETFPSFWAGKMDEVLFFDSAKNEQDFREYYIGKDTWPVDDENLIHAFQLSEGTGDQSGPATTTDRKTTANVGQLRSYPNNPTALMWCRDRPFLGDGADDTSAPGVPSLSHSDVTANQFKVNTSIPSDNIWTQGVEIQVSESANFIPYQSYDSRRTGSAIITNITAGSRAYYRARSYDAAGNYSAYSAVRNVQLPGRGDQTPPDPPVATGSSDIGHLSFVARWQRSPSSDVRGYKIDIASDAQFREMIVRNQDVGNALEFTGFRCAPETNYYHRVRTYDFSQNESRSSNTVRTRTLPLPDVTPPEQVVALPAVEVGAAGFTARWEETSDDVGVIAYLVDVSQSPSFATYLTADRINWHRRNVGNVLLTRVEGLKPLNRYWYRVMAVDEAGNRSPASDPILVETYPASVVDGGTYTQALEPVRDMHVQENLPDATFAVNAEMPISSRAGEREIAYVGFDLQDVIGTIRRASLSFHVETADAGGVTIRGRKEALGAGTTWATRPAGTAIVAGTRSLIADTTITQDVTQVIEGFGATPGLYTFELAADGTGDGRSLIRSSEALGRRPTLTIEVDPRSGTQPDSLIVTGVPALRRNMAYNPSVESVLSGYTSDNANRVWANGGIIESRCVELRPIAAGAFALRPTYEPPVSPGEPVSLSAYLRSTATAGQTLTILIRFLTASGAVIEDQKRDVVVLGDWERYGITTLAPANASRMSFSLSSPSDQTPFQVDGILFEKSAVIGTPFSGTYGGGYWETSDPALSQSLLGSGQLDVSATYLGDANQNVDPRLQFRALGTQEWLDVPTVDGLGRPLIEHVRADRRVTARIGPSFGLEATNRFRNGGFESSSFLDLHMQGGASWERTTSGAYQGNWSLRVTLPTGALGARNRLPAFSGEPDQPWSLTGWVKGPAGKFITMGLWQHGVDYNAGSIGQGNMRVTFTGDWQRFVYNFIPPAGSRYARPYFWNNSGDSYAILLDNMSLLPGTDTPVISAFAPDSVFDGYTHTGLVSRTMRHESRWEVRALFTDPDGISDRDETTTTTGVLTSESRIGPVPEGPMTYVGTTITPSNSELRLAMDYSGDDNRNASAIIEIARSDLLNWESLRVTFDRGSKRIYALATNLRPGASYQVRVQITDPDGVIGGSEHLFESTTTTTQLSPDGRNRITFGGFMLQGRQDGNVGVRSHNAFSLPDRRLQVEDLARVDGSIKLQDYWGTRKISMNGIIRGRTRGELFDNLTEFRRAMAQADQRLVIDTLAANGRYFIATVESLEIPEEANGGIRHLEWNASFVCSDPFSYDQVEQRVTLSSSDGADFYIRNAGTLGCHATIEVRSTHQRPFTFTLQNMTNGGRVTPSQTMARGDRIVLNSAQSSVTRNNRQIDYQGVLPKLDVGLNRFRMTIPRTPSGAPTVDLVVRYRQRYF